MTPNYYIWGLAITVFILNMIMFFHDPFKFSNSQKCLFVQCRKYSIIYGLVTLFLDFCLLISLTFIAPPPYLPSYWFIPIIILSVMIILLNFNESKIIAKENRFSPPPEYFFRKNGRIVFRSIILTLYIIIFASRYLGEAQPTIPIQGALEKLLFNRFGGLSRENAVFFIMSMLTILSIPLATVRLTQEIIFHPTKFNLPLIWYS